MATWYVDSSATGGTGAGTSWTNACLTTAAAIALSAAGDDFNIYSGHAETQASALTLTFKGTAASPNRIFSCDRTNTPAQASDLVAGASISTSGAFNIAIGGDVYCYGLTFSAGSAANAASIILGSDIGGGNIRNQTFENVSLILNNTSASSGIKLATSNNDNGGGKITFNNSTITFGAAGQSIINQGIRLDWLNTKSAIAGTAPTTLITMPSGSNSQTIDRLIGLDFSALGSGHTIFGSNPLGGINLMTCCELGASVVIAATPISQGGAVTDYLNCSNNGTPLSGRFWYQGTLSTETVVIRSGGAPQSWKVATTPNNKRYMPFECLEIGIWCVAGTPVTVYGNSITDLVVDATPLTNADLWIEAQVMDSSGSPISDLYTTSPTSQLTAGTTLTANASSGSWTTTGMTTPDARQQSLTFTPQISGYVRVTYKVGRASLTSLRVDPGINV